MDDHSKTNLTDGITEQNPLIQDRTVVALFASEDDARNARQSLNEAGFDKIDVTQGGEDMKDPSKATQDHGFWHSLKAFFGNHDDAHVYGEGVRRGQTLLTVHAQQGRAATAVEILDRFHPTDVEGAEQAWRSEGWTGAEAASPLADDIDAQPAVTSLPVVKPEPVFGNRDPETGNLRVRSYVRDPSFGDRDQRPDNVAADLPVTEYASVTGGDVPDEAEVSESETLNKAWEDRTHGLADKRDEAGIEAPTDPLRRP